MGVAERAPGPEPVEFDGAAGLEPLRFDCNLIDQDGTSWFADQINEAIKQAAVDAMEREVDGARVVVVRLKFTPKRDHGEVVLEPSVAVQLPKEKAVKVKQRLTVGSDGPMVQADPARPEFLRG
jgi:hypothetical protein